MDKIWLKHHLGLEVELEEMDRRIQEGEQRLLSLEGQKLTDMPKGGQSAGLDDKITNIADLKKKRDELSTIIDDEKKQIETMIEKLSDPYHRTLMRYRYLGALSWEKVAEGIGYSVRYTKKLHGDALQKLFPKDSTQ